MKNKKNVDRVRKIWEDSEFTGRVRVNTDMLYYLKKTKGTKSIAGRLDEILREYAFLEIQQKHI